jgi:hypothetical protein
MIQIDILDVSDTNISDVEELLNYALYLGQRVHGMNTETLLLIGLALEQTRELRKVADHEND